MSITTLPDSAVAPFVPVAPPNVRICVNIQEEVSIPSWIVDVESFLRWVHSEDFPERGKFSYLNGEIWVDLSMEELNTHNKVKSALGFAILKILERTPIGEYICDGMLFSNANAGLSTEPDGLVYLWSTIESQKLVMVPGKFGGIIELTGTPDLTIEVVSIYSERKDTVKLRKIYWTAGIPEYWLVDARNVPITFEILRHTPTGYESTPSPEGWQTSSLLGHSFRLVRSTNPLGMVSFVVESRSLLETKG